MKLNPYLTFDGRCEEAFKFYKECLGGSDLQLMTHGGTPLEKNVTPDWHKKILHAQLTVGNFSLMGSDAPPEYFQKPQGFSVALAFDKVEDATRVFNALKKDGIIKMDLAKTFWAESFGMLIDQFGIPWIINCEVEK